MSVLDALTQKGWLSCPECDSKGEDAEFVYISDVDGFNNAIVCRECGYQDEVTALEAVS